jgi:hypothetical protein
LRAKPLSDAADWIEDYRRFWERSFDALGDHLTAIQNRQDDHTKEETK